MGNADVLTLALRQGPIAGCLSPSVHIFPYLVLLPNTVTSSSLYISILPNKDELWLNGTLVSCL